MKGVELPINVLVIVAIAVIVLLGLIALYFLGFGPFSELAGRESIKNNACVQYNQGGCTKSTKLQSVNYDVDKDGTITPAEDNLYTLATTYYGCTDDTTTTADEAETCAKRLCACPGY